MMHIHACSVNQWPNEAIKIIVGGVNGYKLPMGLTFVGHFLMDVPYAYTKRKKNSESHSIVLTTVENLRAGGGRGCQTIWGSITATTSCCMSKSCYMIMSK